tara:strand:+ start:16695 stop:17699 length:1005 start_codon:yes stop_codon:yes gene_type:complete
MFSHRPKDNWSKWHHIFHKQFLHDNKFIPKNANLLIAVSGGQDSMALMTLINDIKSQHNWTINVWHGDHQWHKNSKFIKNNLEDYCAKNDIPFYCDTANKEEISSEDKARNWRYEKLCKRVDELNTQENLLNTFYIITGHTSTDSSETFLLNLARGSNYAGLSGIPKKRSLKNVYEIRRPILIFSRKDTYSFCQSFKIPFWEDPTNLDLSIKRNLIRHKVIPFLNEINPGATNSINKFVAKMSNYNNEQADLCKLALEACRNKNGIRRVILNKLGIEARSTIIHTFIKEKCTKQISSQNIDTITLAISSKDNGSINLPSGLKIIWTKNTIKLEN